MKNKKEVKDDFIKFQNQYLRLGKNIEEALNSFLIEEKIPYVNVYHRVKEFESFYEKIGRKNYSDPFNEIEDICGIRIICYYASDIHKIEEIIKRELIVLETEDKAESLGLKEFAYRSTHNIVKIKDSWTATPNYRGLENLRAEIQIRTILMHAWAEIEHKLNYKSDAAVPSHFQRKLFRLSAKFEEADEQFEELKNGINGYRTSIQEKTKVDKKFDLKQDFNIDSYTAFLNFHFEDINEIDLRRIDRSFEEYSEQNLGFKDLDEIINKFKPYFEEISNDLKEGGYMNDVIHMPTELLGFAMQVIGKYPYDGTMNSWKLIVEKWKIKLN